MELLGWKKFQFDDSWLKQKVNFIKGSCNCTKKKKKTLKISFLSSDPLVYGFFQCGLQATFAYIFIYGN